MKRNKNFFDKKIQTVWVLLLGMLLVFSSTSFVSEKYVVLYGGDSVCAHVNYLPSGIALKIKEKQYLEVVDVDSCETESWLHEGGGWIKYSKPAKKRIKVLFKLSEFKKPEKLFIASLPVAAVDPKRIVVINPQYPYGKSQIYMGGSVVSVVARLKHMGHEVQYIDFNLDPKPENDTGIYQSIKNADVVALSLTGAPYIPSVIELVKTLPLSSKTQVLVGGQVIERLTGEQFARLMPSSEARCVRQIVTDTDLADALGCFVTDIPNAYSISYIPAWQCIGDEKIREYLSNEIALVLSQGCHFQCAFCAASKAQREKFKSLDCFSTDMRFLAQKAKEFGIGELQFYATSLDFFQNPQIVARYLEILATIQAESGIRFKIRCLACMSSFLKANEVIGRGVLKDLIQRSGLWCVGFGVDGGDAEVWKAQKKRQNNVSVIKDALDLGLEMGIRSEILLVMGFPQDTFRTLGKCVVDSVRYTNHWPNTMLRPYLAKEYVPGNDGWKSGGPSIETFISDPKKFYNLDFCAIGSKSTHPRFLHRMWSNLSYLTIIALFTPFGKCVTSPLLPQGNRGLYGKFARFFNRIVPMDR